MSLKGAMLSALSCALLYAPPASAQEFKTIFNGIVGEQRVLVGVDGEVESRVPQRANGEEQQERQAELGGATHERHPAF